MTDYTDSSHVQQAHDYLLKLGVFSQQMAAVDRAPRYTSGDRENDAEHSFHLALSATELAVAYFPHLDAGLVTQFALVHDSPEAYAGDVWTFDITDEARDAKEAAEREATERLMRELPPYTAQLLRRYEEQQEPEARFVRAIDKLVPLVTNITAGSADTFLDDMDITERHQLEQKQAEHLERIQAKFPEFELVHAIKNLLGQTRVTHYFGDK